VYPIYAVHSKSLIQKTHYENMNGIFFRFFLIYYSARYFNEKLREHRVDRRLTVQKMCSVCKGEKEVGEVLDRVWCEPLRVQEFFAEILLETEIYWSLKKD